MILLIDNYDSFSYNLYQLIGVVKPDIKVIRNDEMSVEQIEALHPELIVISPGPGRPEHAGICLEAVRYFKGKIPILGVCLGHQVICEAYGAKVDYAKQLMHGKTSEISVDTSSTLFLKLSEQIKVGRYHSLAVDAKTLPPTLKITAQTEDGEVMAVEDFTNHVYGLQFHPESVLTEYGLQVIQNIFYKNFIK